MLRNIPIAMMRTFEAAARTGSFRAAADELFLSPSAVSHAIRRLEDHLGTSLFKRSTRTIVLTPAGETLYSHVGRAFDELRQGSFAAQWLLPRLRRFLETHPQIDLRLAANTEYARFEYNEFDLDVVYGKPRSEGQLVVPLAEELLTPLCSKEMAAQIRTVEDLYRVPLIQSDVKQIRWPAWFEHHGMPSPPLKGARFDRSFLAIAAAADGLGVALESTLLAERELARGDLVRPLAGIEQEMYYTGHYLTYSHATRRLQAIGEFREWMMAELGMPGSSSAAPT